jgi:hypothetical protein
MLRTSKWVVAVAVVLLAGQACFADFTADLTMTAGLTDLSKVSPGDTLTFTVMDTQAYNASAAGASINYFRLNFADSSSGVLAALQNGTWFWGSSLGSLNFAVDNVLNPDLIVSAQGLSGVTPASPITVGTLTITAPITPGTYTLSLAGGDQNIDSGTEIIGAQGAVIDAQPSGGFGGGITLTPLSFTVMPEPATLALLGLGGLVTLLRRRR